MKTISLAALVFLSPFLGAQEKSDPAADLPRGESFRLEVAASHKEVAVDEPLELSVRIIAEGPVTQPPVGAKLNLFPPDFKDDFHHEFLSEKKVAANTWVLQYRLKPKTEEVQAIPRLELEYYSQTRQENQFAKSEEIPLTVKPPRQVDTPPEVARALRAPASVYELTTGPALLERWGPSLWSESWFVGLILLGPPLGCVLGYWIWRRRNPDLVQQVRRRQSRAARLAYEALHAPALSPHHLAAVVSDYLRQRLDLPGAEPTPAEVDKHLFRLGVSRKLRDDWLAFLQECDAQRFAAEPRAEVKNLLDRAKDLIHALEAEPCL